MEIASILCTKQYTADRAKKILLSNYNIDTSTFTNIDKALDNKIDAVSICSPSQFHYAHILKSLDKGLPIFCEKPFFWDCNYNLKDVRVKLNNINENYHHNILINTSNSILLDIISKDLPKKELIKTFTFNFQTRGENRYKDIGIDLLPHGLSLIIFYFGMHKIKNFYCEVSENKFY